jgi:hypothetical protein
MRYLVGLLFFAVCIIIASPLAYAAAPIIGLQPLQYTDSLQRGERKKAFIDVTNPSSQAVTVQFDVQRFKQIDEKGALSFYDDPLITQGVLLDYSEKEIPAKKTLRLFFIVDGEKLPTGDVFAAIFARTKADDRALAPSVRVGTLLILTNGTPGARQAQVTSLQMPLLHFGKSLTGEVKIKNTAPAGTSSGFNPKIDVQMQPFGSRSTITAPLIFAGNTRTIKFDQPSNQFGVYKIVASYGSSHRDQWVIVVTGIWRWISIGIVALIAVILLLYKFVYKKPLNKRR